MRIKDFLREDLILPEIRATHKNEVLRELAEAIGAREPEVNAKDLVTVLMEREKLGSTALAEDLAIPHAKVDGMRSLIACLGRSRKGVDFGADDGRRTHFFFLLVAPKQSTGDHLKALARISRLFRHEGIRERLKTAGTGSDMYRIIDEADNVSAR